MLQLWEAEALPEKITDTTRRTKGEPTMYNLKKILDKKHTLGNATTKEELL